MKYDNDDPKTFSLVKMLSLCQKAQFLMMLCLNLVNIPSLHDILSAVIGGTRNKDATEAMIYSMILNSHNRRVSLIQKRLTVPRQHAVDCDWCGQ